MNRPEYSSRFVDYAPPAVADKVNNTRIALTGLANRTLFKEFVDWNRDMPRGNLDRKARERFVLNFRRILDSSDRPVGHCGHGPGEIRQLAKVHASFRWHSGS
jgi:hypothetical protein